MRRTPLFDEHVGAGGKMVPFAGFEMPIQYATGITREHEAVRRDAGLFDASHMGEFVVRGSQALDLVQHLTTNDAARLQVGQAQYSVMCTESGGVVDDLLVYRFADRYMLVVNASNLEKDWAWVNEHAGSFDVELEDASDGFGLIALQGPKAREILGPLTDARLDGLAYYRFAEAHVSGVPAVVSVTGYTGEDGFELYVPSDATVSVWRALLEAGAGVGLLPAGLGARDSLRLEMGYALYGNELDATHTPLEAGLGWITKLDKGSFVGREALMAQREGGPPRRLVGMTVADRGFPRAGYGLRHGEDSVGTVTSGTVSPSLGVGIAMAYVPTALSAPGTALQLDARGRRFDVALCRTPFYSNGSIRR